MSFPLSWASAIPLHPAHAPVPLLRKVPGSPGGPHGDVLAPNFSFRSSITSLSLFPDPSYFDYTMILPRPFALVLLALAGSALATPAPAAQDGPQAQMQARVLQENVKSDVDQFGLDWKTGR